MKMFIFYAIISCLCFACGSKIDRREQLVASKWKLQAVISRPFLSAKRDSIPSVPSQKEAVQIIYQFQKDKKYTFQRGTQIDKGDWGMSSDEKVLLLRSSTQTNENSEFQIHTLNSYQLVISSEHKGKQEILYLIAQ